jgi:hypothetical protein
MDGTEQVMLYLRHKDNSGVGADTRINIQSPITTDEQEHPFVVLESTITGVVLSTVTNGEEVLVEVTYLPTTGITPQALQVAHKALLDSLEKMEVIW